LLSFFDLSIKEIDSIIGICANNGISAKITGAGQGGYCLAFVPDDYLNFE
jgi:mevalonate kinase